MPNPTTPPSPSRSNTVPPPSYPGPPADLPFPAPQFISDIVRNGYEELLRASNQRSYWKGIAIGAATALGILWCWTFCFGYSLSKPGPFPTYYLPHLTPGTFLCRQRQSSTATNIMTSPDSAYSLQCIIDYTKTAIACGLDTMSPEKTRH